MLEIDGASNNGVDQVRDLRDNVRYAPAKGRYKIYIIDEVHMLSAAAFNALLKTLEEPPAHVKFVFATTEVHKMPATILSRCQRFDLRRIPEPTIRAHLAHICELEKVTAEGGALDAIARYAEGGLRDAESALDQAISFYGDRVSEADVLTLFGLTGFRPVATLGTALAQGDMAGALRSARELAAAGKDLAKLSQDLLGFFRNLVIFQVSPGALEEELSESERAIVAEVAPQISRPSALAILEELSLLENRLRYALAKDVVFEVAVIQMSQLREKISLESVLAQLGGAPAQGEAPPSAPAASASQARSTPPAVMPPSKVALNTPEVTHPPEPSTPVTPPSPAPPVAASVGVPVVTTAAAQAAWKKAAEVFAAQRPMEADTIRALEFHTAKAGIVEVMLPAALEKKIHFLRSPRNAELLEQTLERELGSPTRIGFLIGERRRDEAVPAAAPPSAAAAPGKPAPPPPSLSQEAFLDDPLIQNALKIFDAKIVSPTTTPK